MKLEKLITDVAGIDISKRWLDVRFAHSEDYYRFENKAETFGDLLKCLHDHGVRRVGMEASGDYEWGIRQTLEQADFDVVFHQPQDIKAFARFRRIKAKSDKKDARLIAQATEHWEGVIARRDPDLIDLAEMMTYYDHVTDLLAQSKNVAEHHHLKEISTRNSSLIAYLKAEKLSIFKAILKRIKARPDLNERFELLKTMPGAGPVVAAGLLIRVPELGSMEHGKAAALVGVAPFDHDSGSRKGKRFISGGRDKPRALLYIAALAAKRVEPALKAFAIRLKDAGKPPKVVLVAIMRKLIEAANLVLKRKTPWLRLPA